MKQRDDGWLGRAVIGTGMAVPLIADVIWMRFDNRPPSTMTLQTPKASIRVEVADTPAARSAGLSRRETLSDVNGLLLKWETVGRHSEGFAELRAPPDTSRLHTYQCERQNMYLTTYVL